MNESQAFLLGSLAINIAVWGFRLFSMPSFRDEFSGGGFFAIVLAGFYGLFYLVIACWPWIAAWFKAAKDVDHPVVIRIFLVSVASSVVLALASRGPAEGVGYYVAMHVLLIWVLYPFMAINRKEAA